MIEGVSVGSAVGVSGLVGEGVGRLVAEGVGTLRLRSGEGTGDGP